MRPRVILLTGAPGSGKSTLGRRIAEALRLPFLARDDVRGGMAMTAGAWRGEIDEWPTSAVDVDAFLDVVELLLRRGVSCVVEYVVRANRPADLERILAAGDAVVVMTTCDGTERRLVERNERDRLIANPSVLRAAGVSTVAEHTAAMLGRMRAVEMEMRREFPVPLLTVDTSAGYDPDLEAVLDFAIGGSGSSPGA